jgi:hypothetical protein
MQDYHVNARHLPCAILLYDYLETITAADLVRSDVIIKPLHQLKHSPRHSVSYQDQHKPSKRKSAVYISTAGMILRKLFGLRRPNKVVANSPMNMEHDDHSDSITMTLPFNVRQRSFSH